MRCLQRCILKDKRCFQIRKESFLWPETSWNPLFLATGLNADIKNGFHSLNIIVIVANKPSECLKISPFVLVPEYGGVFSLQTLGIGFSGKANCFLYGLLAACKANASAEKAQINMEIRKDHIRKPKTDKLAVKEGAVKGDKDFCLAYGGENLCGITVGTKETIGCAS